jgi:hypothetical protein
MECGGLPPLFLLPRLHVEYRISALTEKREQAPALHHKALLGRLECLFRLKLLQAF